MANTTTTTTISIDHNDKAFLVALISKYIIETNLESPAVNNLMAQLRGEELC